MGGERRGRRSHVNKLTVTRGRLTGHPLIPRSLRLPFVILLDLHDMRSATRGFAAAVALAFFWQTVTILVGMLAI